MCLIQYIILGHNTNYWAVIEIEEYPEHCETFEMERIMRPEIFQGRRVL